MHPILTTSLAFARRNRKRILIGGAIVVPIVGIILFMRRPATPEYITAIAKHGDVRRTVEVVGTVASERDLALQFPVNGIVAQVLVREGDNVKAGQRLANLRSGTLAASVSAQAAAVAAAEAQLRALQEGTRPEDLAIARAEVESKRASVTAAETALENAQEARTTAKAKLSALEAETGINMEGHVATVGSTISKNMLAAEMGLNGILDVFSNNDLQDAITRDRPEMWQLLEPAIRKTLTDLEATVRRWILVLTEEEAMQGLTDARTGVSAASSQIDSAYAIVAGLSANAYLSTTDRETYKSSIAAQQSSVQAAIVSLDSTLKEFRDASASQDTRIAAERVTLANAEAAVDRAQTDLVTMTASLRVQEAQLALKEAGTRQADIDASAARLRQAQADLARARASLADTVITAPVAGTITAVHIKVGEALPSSAAITMLGTTPERIEAFVPEIDVPNVAVTQSGSIELDAFPNIHMALTVTDVDRASTTVDGVEKYRVLLHFVYPHPEVRLGMSGDVTIVTGERSDVISIPKRAVLTSGERPTVRVLLDDGIVEQRAVTMGMEVEDGMIEVINGVGSGETVILLQK